jgi:hypothetical protein
LSAGILRSHDGDYLFVLLLAVDHEFRNNFKQGAQLGYDFLFGKYRKNV